VLASALEDAGLLGARCTPPRHATAYARRAARLDRRRHALAVAWLLGQLDDQVDVPLELVCAALHLEPAALADTVRRRCA
jgi:hypothetical protein